VPLAAWLRTGEVGRKQSVPVVRVCSFPDCSTLTMGEFCLEHERVADGPDRIADRGPEPDFRDVVLDPVH
jgi:hypothetical protein